MKVLSLNLLLFVLIGMYMGNLCADIIQAVAKPRLSMDEFFVTQAMFQQYTPLLEKEFLIVEWLTDNSAAFILVHLLVLTICYILLLTSVLEKMKVFWQDRKGVVFVIAFSSLCFHILLLLIIFLRMDTGTEYRLYEPVSSLPYAVFLLLIYGLFTLFAYAGELVRRGGDMRSMRTVTPLISSLFGSMFFALFIFILNIYVETFGASLLVILGPGEGSEAGWQTLHYVMMAVFSLIVAFSGLLVLFLLGLKPIPNTVLIGAVLAITFILGKLYASYCDDRLDMRFASLNEAAKLTVLQNPPPVKRLLLLNTNLAYDENSTAFIPWERRVKHLTGTYYPFKKPLDLVEENILPLTTYLQHSGHTYYTDAARQALLEMKKLDLDIDGYNRGMVESMRRGGTFLNAIMLTVGLSNMPATEDNRKFLEQLSDENVFHISDTNALMLAKLWIRFGDEQKALYFYEKHYFYEHPNGSSDEGYFTGWEELQKEYRFNKGRVSGTLYGLPAQTQVALVSCERSKERPSLSIHEIKAVTRTSDNGGFSFENLGIGEYTLAIVLPDSLQVVDKPETVLQISISEENPQRSDIDITIGQKM